jgi:hypothetical protein
VVKDQGTQVARRQGAAVRALVVVALVVVGFGLAACKIDNRQMPNSPPPPASMR